MTILDWIGSFGVIVTILATGIAGAWWLQGKFVAIEKKFVAIDKRFLDFEHRMEGKFLALEHWMEGKFIDMEHRMDRRDGIINVVVEIIKDMLKVNETIMTALVRSKLILPDEQATLYKSYSSSHANFLNNAIKLGIEKSNPITKEEGQRLWKYRDMCLAGARFTIEEAEDFHRIVHALEDVPEVHKDGGYGVLISLAALVLGATLTAQDEAKRQKEVMNEN
ncbi:MAG: hypothetical protein AB1567_11460 [bacterium]